MVGELSDDGHWIWDGAEWQPYTPDETPQEQPAPQASEETQVPEPTEPTEPTEPASADTTHADAEMPEPAGSLPLPVGQLPELPLPGMPLPMPVPGSLGPLPGLSPTPPKVPSRGRIVSGVVAVAMAGLLLLFIGGFVVSANNENIEYFDDGTSEGDAAAETLGTAQLLTYVSLVILLAALILGLMNVFDKSQWWWLPACVAVLTVVFTLTAMTVAEASNEYNTCDPKEYSNCDEFSDFEETIYDQDAMIAGYCSGLGLVIIGVSTLLNQRSIKRVSLGLAPTVANEVDGSSSKTMLVIGVLVLLIVGGVGYSLFGALSSPAEAESDGPQGSLEFMVVDAIDTEPMDENGGNALVVIHIIGESGSTDGERFWEFVEVNLNIVNDVTGERAIERCYWSGLARDSGCEFDEMDADSDSYWDVNEGIILYEAQDTDLCSGADVCNVVVTVSIGSASGTSTYLSSNMNGVADPSE